MIAANSFTSKQPRKILAVNPFDVPLPNVSKPHSKIDGVVVIDRFDGSVFTQRLYPSVDDVLIGSDNYIAVQGFSALS